MRLAKFTVFLVIFLVSLQVSYANWVACGTPGSVFVFKDSDYKNMFLTGCYQYDVNFDDEGANDKISSLITNGVDCDRGYAQFCTNADFGGECSRYCGAWPNVAHNDMYSSMRILLFTMDESSTICSDNGKIWAGAGGSMNCCDGGDFFVFGSNKKLCSNSLIYECQPAAGSTAIPVTVGQTINGVLCQEGGTFPAMPTDCTIGTNEGADQGTKPCCDETKGVYEAIVGQDTKCYAKSSVTADYFQEACEAEHVGGDWLPGEEDSLTDGINKCCGDDNYEIIKSEFEDQIAVSNPAGSYNLKSYDEKWDAVAYGQGALTTTWDDENKNSGERSLVQTFSGTDGRLMSKPIYFLPGNYTLSFYAKTENFVDATFYPNVNHDPSRRTVIRLVGGTDAWLQIFKEGNKLSGTTGWHKEQLDFEVKTPITAYIDMPGGSWSKVSGKLWVDDFKLIRRTGSDLGSIEGDYVCAKDNEEWRWMSPTTAPYQIVQAGNEFDILSNSAKWFSCSPGFVLDWVDNPISGALEEELTEEYLFEEEPIDESEYTFEETETGTDVRAQEVSQEEILSGIEGEQQQEQEEIVSLGNEYSLSIQPKIVTDGILILNIEKAGGFFEIRNESGKRIKIGETESDGTISWTERNHLNKTSVDGKITVGVKLSANLQPGNYHLNITIIDKINNRIDNYAVENAFSVAQEYIVPNFDPFNVYPGRFFCSFRGGDDSRSNPYAGFTECCGPSYRSCFNHKEVSRIAGGPVSLVKDYGEPISGNVVLRVLFPGDRNYEIYRYPVASPLITKWSEYDHLEFDIFFAGTRTQNLRLKISDNSENVLFDDLAITYSISGNAFNKWHRIAIPLNSALKSNEIGEILFYANGNELKEDTGENCEFCLRANNIPYRMIFGVDRLFLSVNNPEETTPQNLFCASDYSDYNEDAKKVGKWIDDMDENMDACNNVASYKWTALPYEDDGSQINCCGDDQKVKWTTTEIPSCQQDSDCEAPLVCEFISDPDGGICVEVNSVTTEIKMNLSDYSQKRLVGSDSLFGGEFTCNSDEVVCGAQNYEDANNYLDEIWCCKLPSGITVDTSSPRTVDNDNDDGILTCNSGEVVCGAQNKMLSNKKLEKILCCPVNANSPYSVDVTYPISHQVDGAQNQGDLFCEQDEVVCGAQNEANDESMLDHIGCCKAKAYYFETTETIDTQNTVIEPTITSELLVEENYYDDYGACWNGMYIENDTLVDVSVEYGGSLSCGNGVKDLDETCDDGNTDSGDGCSNSCFVETGWVCIGSTPSVCVGICGDGLRKGTEACDDGNVNSGDGCSNVCTVELGYTCLVNVEPSECVVIS